MKKVIRSAVVVAFMFVVATGLANKPKLSLTPNTEKSLNFEMEATSVKTSVSIVDNEKRVIYLEDIAVANGYSKKFDLKNLPEGEYFLKIEDALKETVFGFSVEGSKIVIAERAETNKPAIRKEDGRVFINLLNLEREAVTIKVVDSENRVVAEEAISDEMFIKKVFNFKGAFEDRYTVIIQNTKNTFYEAVSVD